MESNDLFAHLARLPDDFWSADRFWRLSESFHDWWQLKAWLMGACFLLLLAYPRARSSIMSRISRGIAAIGAFIIFCTLLNQGLGWIGDVVLAIGFFGMCVDSAMRGAAERRAHAQAMQEVLGVRKMTPERAAVLAITGQASRAISEAAAKGQRAARR